MKKNLLKHLLVFIALLLSYSLTRAQSGTLTFYKNTIDFVNLGTVVHDGENCVDIPNIQINIFNANTEVEAANRTHIGSIVYAPKEQYVGVEKNYLLLLDVATGITLQGEPPHYLVITSTDGNEFYFKGIRILDSSGGLQPETKVEGFRNGTQVASVILQMGTVFEKNFDNTSFTSDKFGNVDEIRISRVANDGYTGNYGGFNDFVFGEPILPPFINVSAATLNIAATVNSKATFDITSNATWTVASNQTWLTISDASGDGNKTITLTAAANPTTSTRQATVTVKSTNLADKTVIVTQAAGTATATEQFPFDTFRLYPNPAAAGFTIESTETPAALTIHTLAGSLVHKQTVRGKTYVDISALQAGVYLVKFNGKTVKLTKK